MCGLLVTRRCATGDGGRDGGVARVLGARGREDSIPGEGGARSLDDRRVGHIHGERFAEHAEAREAEHRKRAKCGWPEDQRPHLCNLASVGFGEAKNLPLMFLTLCVPRLEALACAQ